MLPQRFVAQTGEVKGGYLGERGLTVSDVWYDDMWSNSTLHNKERAKSHHLLNSTWRNKVIILRALRWGGMNHGSSDVYGVGGRLLGDVFVVVVVDVAGVVDDGVFCFRWSQSSIPLIKKIGVLFVLDLVGMMVVMVAVCISFVVLIKHVVAVFCIDDICCVVLIDLYIIVT